MSAAVVPGAVSASSPVRLFVRRVAAVGCAAIVAGVAVAFLGGRLAMRLLAAANPGATGMTTDDGFVVGDVTAGGSAQLLLAAVQLSLLGAVLYLLLRPLLIGPEWFRTTTLAVGVATCFAALLVAPDGFDFARLDPAWLPLVLFWLLPFVHTALFCDPGGALAPRRLLVPARTRPIGRHHVAHLAARGRGRAGGAAPAPCSGAGRRARTPVTATARARRGWALDGPHRPRGRVRCGTGRTRPRRAAAGVTSPQASSTASPLGTAIPPPGGPTAPPGA
jgi:hypothetical protein